MKAFVVLLACLATSRADRACSICQLTVSALKNWYAVNGPTEENTFHEQILSECNQLSSSSDISLCKTFADCQFRKIHLDIHSNSETPERTCIDIGSCPGPLSSSSLTIVDWTAETTDYNVRCVPVALLVLHHTVTHAALETLQILQGEGLSVQYITEKNGTVYQMVHDYYRAWHAGVSYWGDYRDINSWAVGVEIVNTGDEPFPAEQMNGVIELARMLVERWHIEPRNIVGHCDINTSGKADPSGYFDWKLLYTRLGFFTGVYDSKLTTEQQKAVLLSPSSYTKEELLKVQQGLSDWGYKGSMSVSGIYDEDTKNAIQSFNRHWCPEVFKLEVMDNKTNLTVTNPENAQWYGVSQERLDFLLKTL